MSKRIFLERVKPVKEHTCIECYVHQNKRFQYPPHKRPVDDPEGLCRKCVIVLGDGKIFKQVVFERFDGYCCDCHFYSGISFRCSFPKGKDSWCQPAIEKRNSHRLFMNSCYRRKYHSEGIHEKIPRSKF